MRGVTLLAIGKSSYGMWAVNMAMSLKAFSDIKVQLICRPETVLPVRDHLKLFDTITVIDESDCTACGLDPCKAKLSLYNYFAYDETIYLDVDGIVIKDINPLFDECFNDFHSVVVGTGNGNDEAWENMWWAWPKDVYEHYNIDKDWPMSFLQSSFMFVRKSPVSKGIFDKALENYKNPIPVDKLRYKWGGGQPDELYFNIALCQLGIDPGGVNPLYITKKTMLPEKELKKEKYIVGLFGLEKDHTHKSVVYWYDRFVDMISRKYYGRNIQYKAIQLMKNKYIKGKK